MRSDGHLIFSYANRSPHAWGALLEALQAAGLRCAGFAIVHSENETDTAKRNVRACTMDLLLDLVPVTDRRLRQFTPTISKPNDEENFLLNVGQKVLKLGTLKGDWRTQFEEELSHAAFLRRLGGSAKA